MSRKTAALAETISDTQNSEHMFNGQPVECIEVTGELAEFLQARIDASNRGEISSRTIQDILEEAEREQDMEAA